MSVPATPGVSPPRPIPPVITPVAPAPDRLAAKAFLQWLDPAATEWEFRTFDDDKKRHDPKLANALRGTIAKHWSTLVRLNSRGAGIYVVVNAGGRDDKRITKIRMHFADFDAPGTAPAALADMTAIGLPPSGIVETRPGRQHHYWRVTDRPVGDFKDRQHVIATLLNGDPVVVNPSRVLRIPGFVSHRADPPGLVRTLHADATSFTSAVFDAALRVHPRMQAALAKAPPPPVPRVTPPLPTAPAPPPAQASPASSVVPAPWGPKPTHKAFASGLPDMNAAARLLPAEPAFFEMLEPARKFAFVQRALGAIPIADFDLPDTYAGWRDVIWACADAEREGAVGAVAAAMAWSQGGVKWNANAFAAVLRSDKGSGEGRITWRSLFHEIDEYNLLVQAGQAPPLVLQPDGSRQAPPIDQWPAHMCASVPLSGVATTQGQALPSGATSSPWQASGGQGDTGGQRAGAASGAAARVLPKPRQWLYGRDLLLGHVSVIVAPGSFGKTAWAVAVALAMACGKPLLGDDLFNGPHAVLFLSQDDGTEEMNRRVFAAEMHHGETFGAGLVVLGSDLLGAISLTQMSGRNEELDHAGLKRLEALINFHQPRVVMLDALLGFCPVGINNNGLMTALMTALQKMAERLGVAFLILHHERKGARDDADSDAAMGAASIMNKARIALRLVRMTEAEAAKSGVLPWDSWQHLALVPAQMNLAPMGQRRWVRLVGVKLGNSTAAYPAGDTVQTVEQWTPSAGGFQFDLSTLRAVVVRIAKGATDASGAVMPFGNGATVRGPRDFAKPIADVLRPGWNGQMPGDKAERAMAEKAVAEGAARGWIVERSEMIPRSDAKGTRPGQVLRAAWGVTPWKGDPMPGPFVVGVAPPPPPPDMAAP